MADAPYQTRNFMFASKGVAARYVDDVLPDGTYLNMDSLEEIEEAGLATRLGTTILSKVGAVAKPLSGPVHSIFKLAGLQNGNWRYASSGGNLYRLSGLNPGQYVLISAGLSGQPWTAACFNPVVSSAPYAYFADAAKMLKDNGTLATPQNMGILQPKYPVAAQAQEPDEIVLDSFQGTDSHVVTGLGSYSGNYVLFSGSSSAAVTATGIQNVPVSGQWFQFQSVVFDVGGANQETVLILQITANGFIADFTNTHLTAATVEGFGLSGTIAASTTATVSLSFGGTPIAGWPTTLDQEDYIALLIYCDPNAIQSITLQFNTANGAYFYRTIGQGPLQPTLNAATDSSTAAADAVLSDTLGLYTMSAGGVSGLTTTYGWTPFLLQLSDFSGAGGADFNDPVMNWQNVTGYEVTIVTGEGIASTSFPFLFQMSSILLFGGAGPDSFAGVGYDYMTTFFNPVDFTESNPSMAMSNVNPPSLTNWVVPRRQPVQLTIKNSNQDPQATYLRIYRRGGTLADNYRRIDEVPLTAAYGGTQTYTDIWSDLDIQENDTISFTNDVPVTSTLPVPVNTTLTAAIGTSGNPVNAVETITPASMANISVNQQVDLGNVSAATFETVIVISITGTTFNAFVQNYHAAAEAVAATASYAQPLDIIAVANDVGYYAGDPQNPSYLYFSVSGNIQAVSSAAYIPVSVPSDAITAVVNSRGNIFVSTLLRWWGLSPSNQQTSSPIVYATAADHGCVGKNAWCLKDGNVYYLAVDGPRVFTGGGSQLISEIVQFIWQQVGPTPIVEANPADFANARVAYWNQFVFFAYTGTDAAQHRLILDTEQKRWRNDDIDAQSMFFEQDTNTLLFGDSNGLVHLDRQNVSWDEENVAGVVTQSPIAINLQTPYGDQGAAQVQKNYTEFTGDFNTNGIPVAVQLLFNDGEFAEAIGTITTSQREKVNLALNSGAGFQAYKVSMQLTGSSIERIFLYQAKIRHILLGETRTSFDSYDLRMGVDESKVLKQIYVETTATAPITCQVFYDGTLGYTFTIPEFGGVRNALRVRLPAISFRIIRFIFNSPSDFILWETSKYEWKPLCAGKSYSTALLMP